VRAGIAALEGRASDALSGYREVLGVWRDLGLVWDEAMCAIDMATLLDPSEPEVASAAEVARRTLTRLGAKPFLARLDAAEPPPQPPDDWPEPSRVLTGHGGAPLRLLREAGDPRLRRRDLGGHVQPAVRC
jgi:hypothetical protein